MKYLIVDDHPLVLTALNAELAGANECLSARSLTECLRLIENNPDIDLVILDLGLPDSQGIQGFIRIRTTAPSMPVLILSGDTDREQIQTLLELGASGFVPKTTATEVLSQAIQLVMAGGIYVPSELVSLKNQKPQRTANQETSNNELTPREQEIVPLLALGLPNKTIASQLGLAENTVRVHVAHIMKKMNVANRTQVVTKLLFGANPK